MKIIKGQHYEGMNTILSESHENTRKSNQSCNPIWIAHKKCKVLIMSDNWSTNNRCLLEWLGNFYQWVLSSYARGGYIIRKILADIDNFANILFKDTLKKMELP